MTTEELKDYFKDSLELHTKALSGRIRAESELTNQKIDEVMQHQKRTNGRVTINEDDIKEIKNDIIKVNNKINNQHTYCQYKQISERKNRRIENWKLIIGMVVTAVLAVVLHETGLLELIKIIK